MAAMPLWGQLENGDWNLMAPASRTVLSRLPAGAVAHLPACK